MLLSITVRHCRFSIGGVPIPSALWKSWTWPIGCNAQTIDRLQCADDYTASIRANALELAGRGDEASQLRTKHIESGSRSEVFYTDEADWQLSKKPPDVEEAMRILALAEARGCATDYTVSVQAKALEAAGRTEEASALRQQQITAGSANAVFFVAEAHWQLRKHEGEAAIRILKRRSGSSTSRRSVAAPMSTPHPFVLPRWRHWGETKRRLNSEQP